ncbi:EamA family transporter [Candidatus Poribacteria bacterium]|nr:EamA family transporter [Candidatus Poribacteria bacterium]
MADIKTSGSVYGGYVLVLLAIIVFSTIEVGSQHLQKEMGASALDVSLLRFSIGGIFLLITACIKLGRGYMIKIIKEDGLRLALLGLIGTTGVSLFFHRSLTLTSSMIAGAIFSINPAIVALVFIVFGVDKPNWKRILGVLLGIACVLVSNIGAQAHEPEFPNYFLGNIFMVIAVLCWSFYFFLVRKYIKKYGGFAISGIVVTCGSIALLLFAPFASRLGWGESLTFFSSLTLRGWLLALYLGAITTGLGYYWLYNGLAKTGVSNGMMVFFIKPALVALLAYFLQGQRLSVWILFGIVLAASSVLMVNSSINRKKVKAADF